MSQKGYQLAREAMTFFTPSGASSILIAISTPFSPSSAFNVQSGGLLQDKPSVRWPNTPASRPILRERDGNADAIGGGH